MGGWGRLFRDQDLGFRMSGPLQTCVRISLLSSHVRSDNVHESRTHDPDGGTRICHGPIRYVLQEAMTPHNTMHSENTVVV